MRLWVTVGTTSATTTACQGFAVEVETWREAEEWKRLFGTPEIEMRVRLPKSEEQLERMGGVSGIPV